MILTPVKLLKNEALEERDESARLSLFVGATAIGDLIKSTLGPHGMDKILISMSDGKMMSTNDGATILKSIPLENPAAKILVDISKVQDDEIGDGTTSVCVLASELLKSAEELISKGLHPQIIMDGYRIGYEKAKKALEKLGNHIKSDEKKREIWMGVAKTALSSKILAVEKEYFANIAVDAVMRLGKERDLKYIHIIKKAGGNLRDSYLDRGFILDKKIGTGQPKRLENAKIMIANTPMDTDKIKIFGARIKVDSASKLAEIERAEKAKMADKIKKIKEHDINCFINRQLIYNWPEQIFADEGIIGIEHADFDGIERLALITGGQVASTFDHPENVKTGTCKLIEEILIDDERMIRFDGLASDSVSTIILRGPTEQILYEAERSIHDVLCALLQILYDPRVVPGGGATEAYLGVSVLNLAQNTTGKIALAIEAYGKSLLQLPYIIIENGGYDATDLLSKMKAEHSKGNYSQGLDMDTGDLGDMFEKVIVDSYKLKRHVLSAASDAAQMIIRVDNIIKCKPREPVPDTCG